MALKTRYAHFRVILDKIIYEAPIIYNYFANAN